MLKHTHTTTIKIAGLCGILVPVVVFICIGLSMANAPWFSWTQNALSDLGVYNITAPLFNIGMVSGGILLLIFSLGLMRILSNKKGAYILSFSSISLIGLGLFPQSMFTLHFITSTSFFVLLTVSLLIIGLKIKQNKFEKNIGSIATVFAIIAIFSTIFLLTFEGIAIPEALSCFPAFVWCMITGVKMIQQ